MMIINGGLTDSCSFDSMDEFPPWNLIGPSGKIRPMGRSAHNRGSLYASSSSVNAPGTRPVIRPKPVIRLGGRSLINSPVLTGETSSSTSRSIHLDDIPEDSPLYRQLQSYLNTQKQGNTYATVANLDYLDDIQHYEKLDKRRVIFLLDNTDIQRQDEPWDILHRYLIDKLYFPGKSYKTRTFYENLLVSTGSVEINHFQANTSVETVYNFSKLIIRKILPIEDWGVNSMNDKPFLVNGVKLSCTYWDYIDAFENVLYYNNERHKHTWFIKICPKVFKDKIPNWFIHWWLYHGPTTKILPHDFLQLYKQWARVSPFLNKLYQANHICCPENISQIYFFIEFSIPWIHKWAPEFGYTEDQIPCLYRVFYNNFWEKMTKVNPTTKKPHGQEHLDLIISTIATYESQPSTLTDTSVKGIARQISLQDQEEDKLALINKYMEQVKKDLLSSIGLFDKKSHSSTGSLGSLNEPMEDAQSLHHNKELTDKDLDDIEEFCKTMSSKGKDSI